MTEERSTTSTRVAINLQGGGRLAGVSQVLKVRLEANEIDWEPLDEKTLTVRGEIHSYVYFMRSGSRQIEGEGLSIPFSREVEAPGFDLDHVDIEIEELVSDHDFDPLTSEFQHRITVILRVRQAAMLGGESQEAALLELGGKEERSYVTGGERPSGDAELPVPAAPSTVTDRENRSEASGETRFSQIRSGPSPIGDPEGEVIEIHQPPASDSEREKGDVMVWKPFPPPIDG